MREHENALHLRIRSRQRPRRWSWTPGTKGKSRLSVPRFLRENPFAILITPSVDQPNMEVFGPGRDERSPWTACWDSEQCPKEGQVDGGIPQGNLT